MKALFTIALWLAGVVGLCVALAIQAYARLQGGVLFPGLEEPLFFVAFASLGATILVHRAVGLTPPGQWELNYFGLPRALRVALFVIQGLCMISFLQATWKVGDTAHSRALRSAMRNSAGATFLFIHTVCGAGLALNGRRAERKRGDA